MPRYVLIAVALAAAGAAHRAPAGPANQASHARGVADPRAFVAQVYAAYGRGDSTPGPDVAYAYSDRLAGLVRDSEAWGLAHNGEVRGDFDFDWWTNDQEWFLSHVSITAMDQGPDLRFVTARFTNEGRQETIRFAFVRVGARWYLDEAEHAQGRGTSDDDRGWTLSALLRGEGRHP